jgi:hypothetical protein
MELVITSKKLFARMTAADVFRNIKGKKEAPSDQVCHELGSLGKTVDALAWIHSEVGSGIFYCETAVCREYLGGTEVW